jgi:hypothetical protein
MQKCDVFVPLKQASSISGALKASQEMFNRLTHTKHTHIQYTHNVYSDLYHVRASLHDSIPF